LLKLNALFMFNALHRRGRETLRAAVLFISCLLVVVMSAGVARADDDFLDPAVAFKFSATEQPGEVVVHYKIADGYYMYRERFAFATRNGTVTIGDPQLPAGHVKFDQTFGKNVETYRNDLTIHIPVKQASGPFDLAVTSQGCADAGICYPPMERVYHVDGAALHAASTSPAPAAAAQVAPDGAAGTSSWYERTTSADYAQSLLQGGSFFAIVGIFFVVGAVLSLLPCSYPMIPILSAIIIGEGARVTRGRGFALSLAYVIGMALVYTVLGIAAALVGQSLGAWLQNPWVLGAFGVLLTVFAVTLIAGYDIALPQRWQDGASRASQIRGCGRDGRVVGASRRRMHDGAAVRRSGVYRAYRQCTAGWGRAVFNGYRPWRPAVDHRPRCWHIFAARGCVDGWREGLFRCGPARCRVVDRLAGA
jgi:thiol:disulfide interchange protein DsbD